MIDSWIESDSIGLSREGFNRNNEHKERYKWKLMLCHRARRHLKEMLVVFIHYIFQLTFLPIVLIYCGKPSNILFSFKR